MIKEKNEKSIETAQFLIKGNIMTWDGNMLQLSNVSSVSTTGLAAMPFPVWTIIVFLAGLFLFMFSWMTALICICTSVAYLYIWYTQNQKRLSTTNLIIIANSGISFQFAFRNKPFLKEILNVLENIIRDGGIGNNVISVDIKNCTIDGDVDVLNKTKIK